ncbi:MAG: 4Fe-4S binding protein [Desulfobacteraceae bacterium]|nr:4Fe-4S binding protein [Desulfobacteraceae bacterium]
MASTLTYLKNVTSLALDADLCTGCGMCTVVCPRAVLSLENGKAQIVDRDACMECGACAQNCPTQALTVEAGVGCAAALINTALGRSEDDCCCVVDANGKNSPSCGPGCC